MSNGYKEKAKNEKIYLYGKNALKEALFSNRKIVRKVFLDQKASNDKSIIELLAIHNIIPSLMKESELNQTVGRDAVHQGVIALIDSSEIYQPLENILEKLKIKPNACLVLLDELQDPHNVGAIIRSAVAFGADAILLPEHNQSPVTGAVIKTSVGLVFKIPIVKIGNVNQTIRLLKKEKFWVYGLAMAGSVPLTKTTLDNRVALIVGNEGDGIRQKTLELCDLTVSIPMDSRAESLNASVATAIVLYEWARQNSQSV